MLELKTLGDRVRYLQNQLGGSVNLEQLTGVSASQQSRLIRNEIKSPGLFQIQAIAKAGGVSLDWLATGEGEPEKKGRSASGYVILDQLGGNVTPPVMFEQRYLEKMVTNAGRARLFIMNSDHMRPDIFAGDVLVIDTANTDVNGLKLYQFNSYQYQVGVLQSIPETGEILQKPSNPAFPEVKSKSEFIRVIGSVVWKGVR